MSSMRGRRKVSRESFAASMRYPRAWIEWGMYPDALYRVQALEYVPGQEEASEHFRYGAFGWWVARKMTRVQLRKYLALTWLDPDQLMANNARRHLLSGHSLDPEFRRLLLLKVPL